jgi:hypothetical protein
MARRFLFLFFLTTFFYFFVWPRRLIVTKEIKPEFGFSYSYRHARLLGLDEKETFLFFLDDLKPVSVRLPVFWDETEPQPGEFDFTKVDWQITQAAKRNIPVVLAVGYRSFHRPECYAPERLAAASRAEFEQALLAFVAAATNHFSQHENIEVWQVENEPLDLFRVWCRRLTPVLVAKEIETIRTHDSQNRPVMLTLGGEIFFRPLWRPLVPKIDIIGVSFYPKNWLDWARTYVLTYRLGPFSPRNLAVERGEALRLGKRFWVVEFQAEPWKDKPITELTPEEAAETITPEKLAEYYEIIKRAGGVERIYFWGVEWWYRELLAGRPAMFEAGKKYFVGQP